ncbi:MAG: ZIP family metal transporter [Phycisphaerales bacterium]
MGSRHRRRGAGRYHSPPFQFSAGPVLRRSSAPGRPSRRSGASALFGRPPLTLAVYCLLILGASLAGGLLPTLIRFDHTRMQLALSLVAGVMFGVGVIHMLPHAIVIWGESAAAATAGGPQLHGGLDPIMLALLLGFLVMFLLERFLSFHEHEPVPVDGEQSASSHAEADSACGHDHGSPAAGTSHRMTWVGAMTGLALHTLLSGIALAASVEAAAAHDHGTALAGFGVFLGVVLHKPFDAMTITMLMRGAGVSRWRIHLANLSFAMMVPAGIVLFHLGISGTDDAAAWTALALAFSAGTFLCIALADLLPELKFHDHDRLKLTAMLILGVAIAWGTGILEGLGHDHDHGHGGAHDHHHHDHDHHDHDH